MFVVSFLCFLKDGVLVLILAFFLPSWSYGASVELLLLLLELLLLHLHVIFVHLGLVVVRHLVNHLWVLLQLVDCSIGHLDFSLASVFCVKLLKLNGDAFIVILQFDYLVLKILLILGQLHVLILKNLQLLGDLSHLCLLLWVDHIRRVVGLRILNQLLILHVHLLQLLRKLC